MESMENIEETEISERTEILSEEREKFNELFEKMTDAERIEYLKQIYGQVNEVIDELKLETYEGEE